MMVLLSPYAIILFLTPHPQLSLIDTSMISRGKGYSNQGSGSWGVKKDREEGARWYKIRD
jgi:hypothetical protein